MNETHQRLSSRTISLHSTEAPFDQAIYRFTDRSDPQKPLHLLMTVRLENDRAVMTAATASGYYQAQEDPRLRLTVRRASSITIQPSPSQEAPERFDQLAQLIFPSHSSPYTI